MSRAVKGVAGIRSSSWVTSNDRRSTPYNQPQTRYSQSLHGEEIVQASREAHGKCLLVYFQERPQQGVKETHAPSGTFCTGGIFCCRTLVKGFPLVHLTEAHP